MRNFYADPAKGNAANDGRGWRKIAFTSGGGAYIPVPGDVIAGASNGATATVQHILPAGVVGQWNMQDNANTVVVSGIIGPDIFVKWCVPTSDLSAAGHISNSLDLNGVYSLLLGRSASQTNFVFPIGANPYSYEFWLCPDAIDRTNEILDIRVSGTRKRFHVYVDSATNKFYFSNGTETGALWDTAVSAGNWYHLVIKYNGTTSITAYVNGVEANTIALAAAMATDKCGIQVGSDYLYTAASLWNGKINKFTMFDFAVAQSDVDALYNSGAGTLEPLYLWSAGTQAGNIYTLDDQVGTFTAEDLDVGAHANVCTVVGDSTISSKAAPGSGTGGISTYDFCSGDMQKCAKSGDAVDTTIDATWTYGAASITLSEAVTKNISLCENSGWTAAANVTRTYDSTWKKLGSYSVKLACGAGFTTGEIGYCDLGAQTDFSGYEQVCVLISGTAQALAAGDLKIKMYSDAARTAEVESLDVPAFTQVGDSTAVAITINKGSALSNVVRCVSLYANTAQTSKSFFLDNMFAALDADNAKCLTNKSIVSRSGVSQGGTEAWYKIATINGTAVVFWDSSYMNVPTCNYYGTTSPSPEALYKRTSFDLSSPGCSFANGGYPGAWWGHLIWSGGWNPATDEQDGETIIDGAVVSMNSLGTTNNLTVDHFSYINGGFSSNQRFMDSIMTNCLFASCGSSVTIVATNSIMDIGYIVQCRSSPLTISDCQNSVINIDEVNTMPTATGGAISITAATNSILKLGKVAGANYGIDAAEGVRSLTVYGTTFLNNATGDVDNDGVLRLVKCTGSGANRVNQGSSNYPGALYWEHVGGDVSVNNTYFYGGTAVSSSIAGGLKWTLSPNSINRQGEGDPLKISVGKFAVNANKAVTAKLKFNRSNTGINATFACVGGNNAGIDNDITASVSAAASTEQELTLTPTPTDTGVLEFEVWVWGGVSYSVDIYGWTISQAA